MESQPLPTTAAWPAPAGAMMAACAVERYEPGASRALFEHLYTQFERPIYRHIYRLLGNAEDARDCTQVAYAKAYLKLGETVAKGDFHPEAWLFRIATNVCRDELRRRRRVQWQDWDAYVSAFHPSQVAHDDPERDALQQDTSREMDVVLRRLLPRH